MTAAATCHADARSAVPAADRIARIRERYQNGPAFISVERARYFTESWKETEGREVPVEVRIALAMKRVYEKMNIHLDPDDRIAGNWCEFFLGVPVDIERGVFNSVLEAELDKTAMLRFRAGALVKGVSYIVRKGMLREFVRNQRMARKSGAQPLNMELKTMAERAINPYQVRLEDKQELLNDLLPYWKGRAVVDVIEKELLDSGLLSREMKEFVLSIPGNTSRQVFMLSPCATIAAYHAHMILDYGPVLSTGLVARKAEIDGLLAAETSPDRRAFLESISLALEGVLIYATRLADRIEHELASATEADRSRLTELLRICRKVPFHAPESFAEAVQAMWTVKTAVETAHPVYLHCFGRLDQELYPFYRADIERGTITREAAVELLAELLLKVMSQNVRPESNILANFYHRFLGSTPITLGGVKPDGTDAANELTSVFLEAADRSRAVANVSIRVHRDSPAWLLEEVAGHLHDGTGSFSLFSDEMNIQSMINRGFGVEDARDYAVMGCVETTVPGRTGPMSANALQLSQLLNITLHNGNCRMLAGTIRDGLNTGDPGSFKTFDEVLEAYYAQAAAAIKKIVKGSNLRDRAFGRQMPAPLVSAFVDGCLESGRDVTRGGARYVFAGVSMINSIANLVDSLLVIKQLVFERKLVTLPELIAAADADFAGREDLLREIRAVEGKWGNGDPEGDSLAREVTKRIFGMTYDHRTEFGGPVVAYVISMITHTIDGRLSMASVDGRRLATPYAASCNPYNVEKNGPTAALRSVAALPFEDVMGCAVNMKFHPTAVGETETARKKWAALIRTYFQLGGAQLQPTVVSRETLLAAQADPDHHRDLIVKVGGYSTYFVNLGREIQDEVIARTEHGMS